MIEINRYKKKVKKYFFKKRYFFLSQLDMFSSFYIWKQHNRQQMQFEMSRNLESKNT